MKNLIVITLIFFCSNVVAQTKLDYKPKILMVTAHPDDDVIFSATVWKLLNYLEEPLI